MYICLLAYSIVSALGVLAWWLSLDTSSPLAIGGIAGCIAPALIAVFHLGCLLYKFCKRDPVGEKHEKAANFLSLMVSTSSSIGVILAENIAAIFPNPRVGFTLIHGMIGLIAPILGLFPTVAIMYCADKTAITPAVSAISITDSTYVKVSHEEVDECITFPEEEVNKSIIFPKVEKVFSARETAV
ncbi:hypothetical protein EJB00_05335 [Wolbachia endosymbiont of Drosophila mauritiana]|uniref:hypothetical protein n=1 Tax=unclassified Wolbachia TaxID=2640676 RepID=UPI00107E6E6E|nr:MULTISPECIES: hypothetical protein [unclassified Wolbachia]QCB62964.1 hypothetical protein EJA99_05350 [Wolbachia endosymbiont of Drosophila mauritiana]QCB64009.1 hypothetical protein EJB00_05335 [Wolbachia endosymbiont of Drosophila mauritiana]QWE33727.1 Uncharacterized protein WwMa_08440 [Wolbachia endosymbiont of Drosophila simulans]TGB06171.1 hypothetical protein E5C28_04785 [Wolbachia endosymbiont of Drosophila mauritiana]